MHLREIIINNVKREKRMADFLGHSDNLITLSLSLRYSLTIVYTLLICAGTRVNNIRLSLH